MYKFVVTKSFKKRIYSVYFEIMLSKYSRNLIISVFCLSLFTFLSNGVTFAQSLSPAERAQLEQQLKQLEEESRKIQADLDNKKGERKGLENELSIINSKIQQSKNAISQTQTKIKKLTGDISVKESNIMTLSQKIQQDVKYVTATLNNMRKLDDVRAVIAFSSEGDFADMFKDFGDYKVIQGELSTRMDSLRTNKKFEEVEKDQLIDKKDEAAALKKKQEQDKKDEEARGKEKKDLISVTKQQEKDYEKVLADKQAKVAQIKSRLFALRDAGGITFDIAQKYAVQAGKATGVRPALILGILKQESDLGKNEGRCYVTNLQTGQGVHSKTGAVMAKVMHPTRDIPPFIQITSSLGIDPTKRLVSCPLSYGYGGAMGPTQFIPSTWMMYKSRVASINGSGGNPWDAQDAITATALYLADMGATSQDYTSERNAACKYYSGKSCARGVGAAGYGNSVMAHAAGFQKDIDLIRE
jgi:membrane-bound lytic murein transglycosylase B